MSSTPERPLGHVLATAWNDFTPEYPSRPPWQRQTVRDVQVAATGNVAQVNLKNADKAQLRNLGVRSDYQDELEFADWLPIGWTVAPPA